MRTIFKIIGPISLVVLVASVIFYTGFYIGSEKNIKAVQESQIGQEVSAAVWPTLKLPLKYFDYKNVGSGSASGEYPNWESATFSNGYRSFPTTTIIFTDYSNDRTDLPPLPTDAEWQEATDEEVIIRASLLEQEEEYGDLGKRFATDLVVISSLQSVDVTGDGVPETLTALGSLGGNHQPHYYQIIQGDKIIFESGKSTEQLAGFIPDSSGNGFTIAWSDNKQLTQGLCCALGNYSTRFIYKDGVFKPLYEQEELYYEIENSEFIPE